MERIFIVGYMGSGKTTVGKQLAKDLSLSFVDLDAYIENKFRKSVSTLFAEKGEDNFRKIESRALYEVSDYENVIISTGGGTPCFFNNMEAMNRAGVTVYLKATPEDLASHLMASKTVRPLIAGKTKEELIPFITEHLSLRESFYMQAQIIFQINRMLTKDKVLVTVRGIEEQLKRRNKE